jgi:hypothetical protein
MILREKTIIIINIINWEVFAVNADSVLCDVVMKFCIKYIWISQLPKWLPSSQHNTQDDCDWNGQNHYLITLGHKPRRTNGQLHNDLGLISSGYTIVIAKAKLSKA